jgi:2,4-dienoyl-CoA reductase-like NADH-dependent reductase (Old Yellow Enzyme family)
MSLEKLFEPITIGNCTLKNRIAMAPMNMGYTGPEGYVSDHTLAWFATRARGGFGLIITECFVVNPHRWRGSDSLNPALFSDRRYFRFVSELVELVHSYDGCKIFIQLSPGWGRQGHAGVQSPDVPAAAPSSVPMSIDYRNLNKGFRKQFRRLVPGIDGIIQGLGYKGLDELPELDDEQYAVFHAKLTDLLMAVQPDMKNYVQGETPRELEKHEIIDLEDRMASAVRYAMTLGFDGVEIHSPHGYLVHQFLSRRTNKRIDEYGGSMENRARFLTNIITKARAKVGPDYPLGARFSGAECMKDGLTNEEAQEFVRMSQEAGINFVNISQGSYENPGKFFPDGEDEFTQYGPGFKKAGSGVSVITPGFTRPETAARAIAEGKTDIVSLGRQAIADPYWPAKAQAGRVKDIVRCTRCDQCVMYLQEAKWATCSVNVTAGKEKLFPELWLPGSSLQKRAEKILKRARGLPQI